MIIQPLFPSPNRVQLYRVVLMHWHPVRQWNTRATQNRILNESTKSIVFRKSLVRFALLLDWNICTRDIGNMLLLPGYCNIRDCWDLLQHFAGFLLSQPPGPARMLAVATPEKIKGNKSLLVAKYKMMATDIIKDNYRISYIPSLKINSHLLKKEWNNVDPKFFPIIESLSQVNSSQKSERCEKLNWILSDWLEVSKQHVLLGTTLLGEDAIGKWKCYFKSIVITI